MTPAPGRLLVVDDDEDIRGVLREFLEAEGYRVMTASNGREALVQLQRSDPCAILLDLMMPIMNGWQFLEERKQQGDLARAPVIVISAYQERAPQDGVAAVLGKPIDLERLLTTLRHHCCPAAAPDRPPS